MHFRISSLTLSFKTRLSSGWLTMTSTLVMVSQNHLLSFQTKYGGKIEYVQTTWDNRYTDLAKAVMANDSPDFFPADDMDAFP